MRRTDARWRAGGADGGEHPLDPLLRAGGAADGAREPNGYREFDGGAVERVRAIRGLLESGFTVEEILSLSTCLTAAADDCDCCGQTAALYRDKLEKIDLQMRTLAQLRERVVARIEALEC